MRVTTIGLFVGWLIIGFVGVGPAFSQSANTLITQETKESWTLLFDGMNTTGWTTSDGKPVPAGWVVKNGILTASKGAQGAPSSAPINRLILTFNSSKTLNQQVTAVSRIFTRITLQVEAWAGVPDSR